MVLLKNKIALGCLNSIAISMLMGICVVSQSAQAIDTSAGEKIYNRCMGCHSLTQNRTGPKHCGLFGRRAGSVKDFEYSEAMRSAGIVWSDETLDSFIKAPLQNLPGTTMGFAGVKDDKEREDLLAYLKQATVSEECRLSL